jgi:predicted lipoprotein with Yx(FWY)xxD motif
MVTLGRRTSLAVLVLLFAALAAGCGSGSSYGGGGGSTTSTSSSAATGPALAAHKTSLGAVLVDPQGRTLYVFAPDPTDVSKCSGACAANWPPATGPAKPAVGAGVDGGKLRTIAGRQLSYSGHPLYLFVGDKQAGDVKGQGVNAFGGVWHVIGPDGTVIVAAPPSAGSGGGSGGGY